MKREEDKRGGRDRDGRPIMGERVEIGVGKGKKKERI